MALNDRQKARKEWLVNMLASIDARMMGDITMGGSAMTFNGRSLTRYSLPELDKLRRMFDAELCQLEAKELGRSRYSSVKVRF